MQAAPFANGSFEQPGVASGAEQTLPDGSTAIAGWTANAGVLGTYRVGNDFSATQNPNGTWEYGYRTTLASSFAIFDTPTRLFGLDYWSFSALPDPSLTHNGSIAPIAAADYTMQPNQLAQHPGPNGELSVVRWNPPHMGTYTIHVDWVGLGSTSTTDAYVLINGTVLTDPMGGGAIFPKQIRGQGSTASFETTNTLIPGVYVEFALGNSGDGHISDQTGVNITITEVGGDPGMVYVKNDAGHAVQAAEGTHYVSFGRTGGRAGTITRTIDTVPGLSYVVNYHLTTEGTDDDGQTMSVEAFDGTTSLGSTSNNIPATQGQWSFGTPFGFTAASTSTRLVFTDTTPLVSGMNASWGLDQVSVHFIVPGSANLWLAGWADGTTALNTDSAPSASPTLAPIAVTPGQDVTFDVIGGVQHNGPIGPGSPGPDGDTDVTHLAENSIPELKAPIDSLVGIFLNDNQPTGSPVQRIDYTVAANRDYDVLMPALQEPFFIGDGRNAAAALQRVRIPAGATRLFLGALDEYDNFGNGGSFGVIANVIAPLPDLTGEFSGFTVTAGAPGDDWTFEITQDPEDAARTLHVQTRLPGGSWVDLGAMTLGTGGLWSLSAAVPLGRDREFRVLAQGSGFTDTTFSDGMTYDATSPAGRILFTRGTPPSATELVIMEADGNDKRVLTDNTIQPLACALSPDGKMVAFTTFSGGLFIMQAKPMNGTTNVPVNILEDAAGDPSGATVLFNTVPAWAPDGLNIAFADASSHIQVIEAVDASGDPEPYDPVNNTFTDVYTSLSGSPGFAWSPDGKVLAVTEGTTIVAFPIRDDAGALTPATVASKVILMQTQSPALPTNDVENPMTSKLSIAWSPDNQQLAIAEKNQSTGRSRLSIVEARDVLGDLTPESVANARTRLDKIVDDNMTGDTFEPQTVSWSSDGTLLAVQAKNGSAQQIEVYQPTTIGGANAGTVLTIQAAGGNAYQPAFPQPVVGPDPSGQLVAFEAQNYAINEGGSPVSIKVARTGGSTGELTVGFTISGVAVEGVDANDLTGDFFLSETSPLTFADGETEKIIIVTPIDDGEEENDETFTITLGTPDIGDVGAIGATTVAIQDNESNGQPFTPGADELLVSINGKEKPKGKAKAKTGDTFGFKVRQSLNRDTNGELLDSLEVKIQATTTPEDAGSWLNLPEGLLSRANHTSFTWVGNTKAVPTGKVFFRTRSYANGHRSNAGPVVGPFTISPAPVLQMTLTAVSGRSDNLAHPTDPSGLTVKPSEDIRYTVTCKNIGTAVAKKVVLTTSFPKGTLFDGASGGPGVFVEDKRGQEGRWNVGEIPPGTTVTHFLDVTVPANFDLRVKVVNNHTSFKGAGIKEKFLPSFNTDVVPPLSVKVAKDKKTGFAGDVITYTITATNNTANALPSAQVTDQVPVGTTLYRTAHGNGSGNFQGVDILPSTLLETPNAMLDPGYTPHDGMLTWNVGTIEAGGSRTVRFSVRIKYDLVKQITRSGGSTTVIEIANYNFDFTGGGLAARGGVVPYEDIARTLLSDEAPANRPMLGLDKEAMSDTSGRLPGLGEIAGVYANGDRSIEYEIGYYNYGNVAARDIVISDGIPAATSFFVDRLPGDPLVYDAAAFMAHFKRDGTPLNSSAGFHFYDINGSELSPGGEPFFDRNHNGKIEKVKFADTNGDMLFDVGEYLDQNGNNKYDGPEAIRSFSYNVGDLAPMVNPARKTLSYEVRVSPKVEVGELLPAFSAASQKQGLGLKLTSPDFFFPFYGAPDVLYAKVVAGVELTTPIANEQIVQVILDKPATHQINWDVEWSNTGGLYATGSMLRVPVPAGFHAVGNFVMDKPKKNIDVALKGSPGTACFYVGTVPPYQPGIPPAQQTNHVKQTVSLALDEPPNPNLFDPKTGELKLAEVPFWGRAVCTGDSITAPALRESVSPRVTIDDIRKAIKANGGVVPAPVAMRKTLSSSNVFIGRIAPFSVRTNQQFDVIIFYGNLGNEPTLAGEVGIQIPDGVRFVEADYLGYNYDGTVHPVVAKAGDITTTINRKRNDLDGDVETVRWHVSDTAAHGIEAVVLRLVVTNNFAGTALTDTSCYVKYTNAPGVSAGPLTIQVCRDSSGAVQVWQAFTNVFHEAGGKLDAPPRTALSNASGQVTFNSHVVGVGCADLLQLTNGIILIPLGGGRCAVIGNQVDFSGTPAHSFVAVGETEAGDMAIFASASTTQQIPVPGSASLKNVHDILQDLSNANSIVAAGGGNIVAAGGGNIVAAGGGNIVAGGGGNLVSNDNNLITLGPITPNNANIVAAGGGNIVAAGGGNIVAAGGGNIVAGGGGNIVAAGGGNIVAAGGGNLISVAKGASVIYATNSFLADQMPSILSKLTGSDKGLQEALAEGLVGNDPDSLIGDNLAGFIDRFQGGTLIGQEGANIVAGGGMN